MFGVKRLLNLCNTFINTIIHTYSLFGIQKILINRDSQIGPCMEDQTAISRMKQGDPGGLEYLVRRYQVKAMQTAYLILQDRTTAEEIVQNAFLKCYEKIHQFRDSEPFAPWLMRIVINDAVKMNQKQARISSLDLDVEDQERLLANWLIDPQPTPEEVVEAMEIEESLMKAIKILPAKQKAAVIMRYFLEMNENEMSDHMEMPLSSIKWWLRTARKKLAELLKP